MRLSILICSLSERSARLGSLIKSLHSQMTPNVEIIVEIDNKQISTGAKRNKLLMRATGDYIVFIDDDDHITENYVAAILTAIETDPDCVGTCGWYSIDGGEKILWRLSKDYHDHDSGGILYRRTNHISPVKRSIALMAMFPDKSNAEDKEYSIRINPHLKTETKIDEPIYHYDYSTTNKSYR